MADEVKVAVGGSEYTLDIPGESHVVRGPVQKEFFTEVDRVSAIQEAIGVEVTGVWDEATNEQFAVWLRVQQATHMGIEESDGWWGKKSEAALAAHMDPDALKALTELRESGRLAKLTFRTDIHNATWEQVETDVVERAAAPDASEAELALAATVTGEENAPAEPIVTSVPPLSYEELQIPTSQIVGGVIAGSAASLYMFYKKPDEKPVVADNDNGGRRHFGADEIKIIDPDKAPVGPDTRPAALDSVIDVEPNKPRTSSFTVHPGSFDFEVPSGAVAAMSPFAFDGNTALQIQSFTEEFVPRIRSFLLDMPSGFINAASETMARVLPKIDTSFSTAADNDVKPQATADIVAEADASVKVESQPKVLAEALTADDVLYYPGTDINTNKVPAADTVTPEMIRAMDYVDPALGEVDIPVKVEERPRVLAEALADDSLYYPGTDINTNKLPVAADTLTPEMIRAMDYVDPAFIPVDENVDTAARLAVEGSNNVADISVLETTEPAKVVVEADPVDLRADSFVPEIVQPVTQAPVAPVTLAPSVAENTVVANPLAAELVDPDPAPRVEIMPVGEADSFVGPTLDLEPNKVDIVPDVGPEIAESGSSVDINPDFKPTQSAGVLSSDFSTMALVPIAAPAVEEVRMDIGQTPDVYRTATISDFAGLPTTANDVSHLNVNLKSLHKISDAGVGISDVVIAGTMFGLVSAVSNAADAGKISAEMFPLIGSYNAYQEGRSAEGEMRWTEDAMGIGFALVGGVFGGSAGFAASGANPLGGAAGAFGGSLAGMYGSIQLSAWMRDYYRSQGMDIDEGMDAGELTSFLGSLTETYPELFKSVYGLDEVERTKLSVSTMEVVARHSQYTMEGMTSADAFTRIQSEFAEQDATLAAEQKALLDGIAGIEDLTGGAPIEEYLADAEKFSQVYRLYKGLAIENPDDAAIVASAEALAKYNDLSLQRTGVQYSELMAGRMIFAAEIAELDKLGPRDEMIAIRYENIIADYETMSPEDQEKYAWIKEAGDRYARRQELLGDFTDERNAIANTSRGLTHIEDDIGHADQGLAYITSGGIAAEQGAFIAQMGENFPYTAEELRNDPSLIAALEKRFEESQAGGVSDFMSDIFNGGTYEMNPEEFALLEQFKGLEPHRAHQEFLETSPVLDMAGKDNIQLEIYRRLPDEVTPDMPGALRVLVESKQLLLSTEQYFAEFGPEDAQDEIDFLYRRRQYDENITYSEQSWYQTFNDVQVRPDHFKEVLDALDIEIENENNAHSVFDYTYKFPTSAPAPASL